MNNMTHYRIEPEVPGELAGATVLDRSTHPPRVSFLEISFDGWRGDPLLEVFPCFWVTENFRDTLIRAKFTGCLFEQFNYRFGDRVPDQMRSISFWRLLPSMQPGFDFCADAKGYLVVSERVMHLLREAGACAFDSESISD